MAGVKVWATDQFCPALKPAVSEISRVPFPNGWIVVIACNQLHWAQLERQADVRGTNSAFTSVQGGITVLNGKIFLKTAAARPAHRVLLHEIGHIQCNRSDEPTAERWAIDHERQNGLAKK